MSERAASAVYVLAGGAGRRMDGPKPLAELAGRPLIAWPLEAAAEAGLEPVVVAKASTALPELECRVVIEPERPRHPLAGIVAALADAGGEPIVCVACDMPFLTGPLLAWLASLEDPVAVCEAAGSLQPLLGRYGPGSAGALAGSLDREEPLRSAVMDLEPRVVGPGELRRFGGPERLCANVNDPGELRAAERVLAGH